MALKQAERAIQLDPHPSNINTLGVAQYRAVQYQKAKVALEKSLALRPESERARAYADLAFLAMTCWQLGQKKESATYLDQLRKIDVWKLDYFQAENFLSFLPEAEELIETDKASAPTPAGLSGR